MKWAVAAALLIGCSSAEESSSPPDAATDTRVADTLQVPDTQFGLDTAEACPQEYPGDGQACAVTTPCTFKDVTCGGTFNGSCVAGKWTAEPHAMCGPYCPDRKPEAGTSCADLPAGRQCTFWPVSVDACEACTCTDGKWVCAVPTTCMFTRAECKTGTTCTTNTGCGAGRCANYCACGVDGVLHCTSTLC